MGPGEKRRRKAKREREQTAYAAKVAELRAEGASCGTCRNRSNGPAGIGPVCDLDSDFYGYSPVKMDGICDKYSRLT